MRGFRTAEMQRKISGLILRLTYEYVFLESGKNLLLCIRREDKIFMFSLVLVTIFMQLLVKISWNSVDCVN